MWQPIGPLPTRAISVKLASLTLSNHVYKLTFVFYMGKRETKTYHTNRIFLSIFKKDFIYLFLERGEGKEKERERNINVWLPFACPKLGTCLCPDWESNW